jgi:long-chain fatty acid transport protein
MLFTCLVALAAIPALAFGNGLYSPGVGARAGAMGGAFIGLADDYSAVYWNPAGITQIKGMELTVTGADVASMASREGFVRFEGLEGALDEGRYAFGEVGATSGNSLRIAPGFFFYTDPGPMRSVVDKVGIAVYTLTEYGAKWDGSDVLDRVFSPVHEYGYDILGVVGDRQDYESRIRNYTISPVIAKEIIPGLSLGLAGNLTYSHFELQDVMMIEEAGAIEIPDMDDIWVLNILPFAVKDDVTAWGYGATFGALYRVNRQASVGLSVRSPMTMSYEGTMGVDFRLAYADTAIAISEKHDATFDLKYPTWAGLGVAWRDAMFDGLTVTADVQWTDWSTFEAINRSIDWGGTEFPEGQRYYFGQVPLEWEDTVEVAVGFDYRLGRSVSMHLGYRNSPSPVPDDTYDFIMPQTAKNVVGLGATMRQDFWRASVAVEYHAGNERNLSGTYDMNGKHVEDIFVPSLSFTYAF